MNKRLYRSNSNKMIAGVCGGLGEYFDIDPTIVRLVFLIVVFFGGSGILLYLIGAIVIPVAPAWSGNYPSQQPQYRNPSEPQQPESVDPLATTANKDSSESVEPDFKINLDKKEDNA